MENHKYRTFVPIHLYNRQWPNRVIDKAPIWASVDLRDGNQSLIDPMDIKRKQRLFALLVSLGLKQIEVGFPSASQTDFYYLRELITSTYVPEDITLQVLTPARLPLIERTFEALKGAKRAIVHLYNATSPLFRETVLRLSRSDIKSLAVEHTRKIRALMNASPETNWQFQYSPEHFPTTELYFSLDVCEAVMEVFNATPHDPVILNLPATVEVATPNVYADQIEWFCKNLSSRDSAIISLHTHNDRGTGIAAAELGLMAGADRIEGTLFGNGERTGNADIVTLAMNLYSQGVDPGLDLSNITQVMHLVADCNRLPVHPRHPYVGSLVFTAFSGSHQDAIKKCLDRRSHAKGESPQWDVPYLPVDPLDVGRSYEARVNSQSGKGGIAYILEHDHGIALPRRISKEFSNFVQEIADCTGREITSQMISYAFLAYYRLDSPYRLVQVVYDSSVRIYAIASSKSKRIAISCIGNHVHVSAFSNAIRQHAVYRTCGAEVVAFVELKSFGVGIHTNTTIASTVAMLSALNRGEG